MNVHKCDCLQKHDTEQHACGLLKLSFQGEESVIKPSCCIVICACVLTMLFWYRSQLHVFTQGMAHMMTKGGVASRGTIPNYTEGHPASTERSTEENYTTTEEPNIRDSIWRYVNSLPNTSDVSVVTAYFRLGALNKMSSEGPYTPDLYRKWMASFGKLNNSLVVYVDTQGDADFFKKVRASSPSLTTIILVKREDLWAFGLAKEIGAVFRQRGYPKHPPNTINPLYSCAMHAKFELMARTVREHRFPTRYVAWVDIGLFRAEAGKNQTFRLRTPPGLDPSKVGYSKVGPFNVMEPMDVVRKNKVWVGGASFVGLQDVVFDYCSEYMRAVRKLLDMKIMSTDQQVIYIMNQPSFDFKPKVQIQTYMDNGRSNAWFSIGYIMKRSGERQDTPNQA